MALGAPFVAPHGAHTRFLDSITVPPQLPRFIDAEGNFHLRPFCYKMRAQIDLDTGRLPLSIFGNYIVNTEAETDGDTGFLVGFSLGKAKAPGSFAVGYNYRDLEADATVGAYADSDVFGGGTNGRGHEVALAYQLTEALQLAGTAFYSALDPDGEDTAYTRFQLDLKTAV